MYQVMFQYLHVHRLVRNIVFKKTLKNLEVKKMIAQKIVRKKWKCLKIDWKMD